MASQSEQLRLAAEFPPATREQWMKLVESVLKGGAFERLIGKTYDGLKIEPIYQRAAGAGLVAGREPAQPWRIMQRVDNPDPAHANAQALQDLENGATGLTLVFADSTAAHSAGLEPTAAALARALDGIYLDAGIAVEFEIGPQSRYTAMHFAELLKTQNIAPSNVDVRFGFDPVGAAAVSGISPYSWADIATAAADDVAALASRGFKDSFIAADGRVVHDAGGTEAQELAFVVASGVAYLRALEAGGIALDDARRMIYARLSADADQFLTMAKFRALRLLWARIEESCGLKPQPLFIAAETAWRMLTQRDPNVNMLRATSAVFSAGLGGANSISVLPHTLALGLPDPFARRIARNTQLILLEESNLAKVADPTAGSGSIESLTQGLCASAWTLFQEIERTGGIWAALEQNLLQKKIAAARAERDKNIARRKDVLIGASEFPNLHEATAEVLDAKPVELKQYGEAKITFDPLMPGRLAAPFEALRDLSDVILKQTDTRPKVFLANLGTPADFTARATFAKSFFETGGIEAIDTAGFSDPATLTNAFKASDAIFVCLCSSDAMYTTQAADAARALQSAGAKHIYFAGRPGDKEADYKAAGVQTFVFAGGDALATLRAAYETIKA